MSGFWYEPQDPAFFTAAGGQASLGEIYQAARDASLYVDNTFAAQAAMERAYDDRNDRIFDLTGEKLDNPYRMGWRGIDQQARDREAGVWEGPLQSAVSSWQGRVRELAGRRPELAAELMPTRSIEEDALALTRDADLRFSQLAGSRSGALKWIAAFAGGGMGAIRDPVQVGTLMLGGGPGAARTVAGRILSTALSEAAVNAGVELALQPIVQSYRARAGLESGVDLALRNAAFAGLLGGVFGAGARGLGELLTSGGRSGDRALAVAAADLPPQLAAEIRAGLPEATAAVRDSLPLPARGALDQVDMIEHLDATRPAAAALDQHDRMVSRAHQAAEALQTVDREIPAFTADPAQIARITDQLVGEAPAPAARSGQSLIQFIKARGGLLDDRGELAAIGAESLTRRGKGKIDKRVPLDMAREAAEEAGYIGRAGEVQTTTVADLLDAIDQELRGNPVFSRADDAAGRADLEAERARVEDRVAEAAAYAGPAVDDAIVREAAEISLRDGVDVLDALESVLIRGDHVSLYHGTPFEFREFDLNHSGTASGSKTERAVFFSPDAKEASNFGLSARGDPDAIFLRNHSVDVSGFEIVDMQGERARHNLIRDALDRARANGRPGVIFRNMDDRSVLEAAAHAPIRDQVAVIDLSRISPAASVQRITRDRFFGDEPLPGWSDAELDAASASRGNVPNPENGSPFDDPGRPVAELEISPDDVGLFGDLPMPSPDGRVISLEAYMADIANDGELAATVKACRA